MMEKRWKKFQKFCKNHEKIIEKSLQNPGEIKKNHRKIMKK